MRDDATMTGGAAAEAAPIPWKERMRGLNLGLLILDTAILLVFALVSTSLLQR